MTVETPISPRDRDVFRVFLVLALAVTVALLDYFSPLSIAWGFLYLGPVVASCYFFGRGGGAVMIPICLLPYHWIGKAKGASFHPGNTWLELGGMVAAAWFTSHLVRINDDLSAAKLRLEANLKQKESIFQATAGGLLLVDSDLRLLDINPTAMKMLGAELATHSSRPLYDCEVAPEVQRFFRRLPSEATASVSERFTVWQPERRTMEVTATRIELQNAGPEHAAWAVALQDLTDLVQAHDILLSKAHTLAVQDTRNRMARDLHDNLAQTLATVNMRLGLLRSNSKSTEAKVLQQWDRVEEILSRVLQDIRQNIWELRPTALEQTDFVSALRIYINEMGSMGSLKGELSVKGPMQMEPDREVLLFYVIQEAITNAQKHSSGERIVVDLKGSDREILATVTDDGKGFDMEEQQHKPLRKTYGLTSMQERINLMGGRFTLNSVPGKGTEVRIQVPLKKTTGELQGGIA